MQELKLEKPTTETQGPRSGAVLLIVFTTVVVDFIGFSILIPVLPEYASRLGANAFEVSAIIAIYALVQLLFLPACDGEREQALRKPCH